jgi:hypothetical protein
MSVKEKATGWPVAFNSFLHLIDRYIRKQDIRIRLHRYSSYPTSAKLRRTPDR